jgi:hypothetical protein
VLLEFAMVLVSLSSAAQAPCAPIDELKTRVYGFRSSALTADGRAKSKEMDQFWDLVKSRKDGPACLRQLLIAEKAESFFLFDGASLLASLDRSETAMPVILNSVLRAPIAEIDAAGYVDLAIRLAREGADIAAIAERFLEHPAETISVPAHALNVQRTYGALLLFGILPIDRADAALTRALGSSQQRVREMAAIVLTVLMTEGGLKVLKQMPRFAELSADTRTEVERARSLAGFKLPEEVPAFTREQVMEHLRLLPRNAADYAAAEAREAKYQSQLPSSAAFESVFRHMADGPPFTSLGGHPRFIRSAALTLTAADLPAVREWRRQSIRSLSDETLGDFMAFTVIVNSVIARFGLYAEYRSPK